MKNGDLLYPLEALVMKVMDERNGGKRGRTGGAKFSDELIDRIVLKGKRWMWG